MPFPLLPLAFGGLSFLGNALANRKKTQTQTSTSTPTLDPAMNPLQARLMEMIQGRLSGESALPAGYETGGISTINNTFDVGRQSLENALTSRGLGTSPVAGAALARHETGRLGTVGGFRSSLPLVNRQLQNEDMFSALNLLGQGRGQTTTSTGSEPGNWLAGGLQGMGLVLSDLFMNGAFGGQSLLPGRQNQRVTGNLWTSPRAY